MITMLPVLGVLLGAVLLAAGIVCAARSSRHAERHPFSRREGRVLIASVAHRRQGVAAITGVVVLVLIELIFWAPPYFGFSAWWGPAQAVAPGVAALAATAVLATISLVPRSSADVGPRVATLVPRPPLWREFGIEYAGVLASAGVLVGFAGSLAGVRRSYLGVFGEHRWIPFAHWSPGLYWSPYPGWAYDIPVIATALAGVGVTLVALRRVASARAFLGTADVSLWRARRDLVRLISGMQASATIVMLGQLLCFAGAAHLISSAAPAAPIGGGIELGLGVTCVVAGVGGLLRVVAGIRGSALGGSGRMLGARSRA